VKNGINKQKKTIKPINGFTLKWIAGQLNLKVKGDPSLRVNRFREPRDTIPGDLSFFGSRSMPLLEQICPHYLQVVFISPYSNLALPNCLICEEEDFYQKKEAILVLFDRREACFTGIDERAVIGCDAQIGERTAIGAYATIGDYCQIGRDTIIHPHAVVYSGVKIGNGCIIHSHAVIRSNTIIEDGVEIEPGAVIGAASFEYGYKPASIRKKIVHGGAVLIRSHAVIGAGTCVQCSQMKDTVIGEYTKIDNMVEVAHGVRIGALCRIAGHTSIAGETEIGDRVCIGGDTSISNNLQIQDDVFIVSKSGVIRDVKKGEKIMGFPAIKQHDYLKNMAVLKKLPEIWDRIREMEEQTIDPGKNSETRTEAQTTSDAPKNLQKGLASQKSIANKKSRE